MTILVPMRPEVYETYLQAAMDNYVDGIVVAGLGSYEQAIEKSRADFLAHLPQGLATPDNYLFEIKDMEHGAYIGFLWFCILEQHGVRTAFLSDIKIQEEWRRQGHATRAFEAMESKIKKLGIVNISLHVFGHNSKAQVLYGKLGYGVSSIYMLKQLDGQT